MVERGTLTPLVEVRVLVPQPKIALLAQLDRASDYESEGREFDSLKVRQIMLP